mgnify:CR=1 FL=1
MTSKVIYASSAHNMPELSLSASQVITTAQTLDKIQNLGNSFGVSNSVVHGKAGNITVGNGSMDNTAGPFAIVKKDDAFGGTTQNLAGGIIANNGSAWVKC